jgi:Fe-S-cluster-containing dehydrogenase component
MSTATATPRNARGLTVSNVRKTQLLQGISFLQTLDSKVLDKLRERAFVRRFEPGDMIVRQGDYGHTMFILHQGALRVEKVGDDGQPLVLARINKPGDCLGEVALLGRARRTASIVADSDCILLEIEKTAVEQADKEMKGKVFKALNAYTKARSVRAFLKQHRYFCELNEQAIEFIASNARLESAPRGSIIFAEQDKDPTVLLLKTSVAKLVRVNATEKTESILSYFNAGDVIGLKHHGIRGGRLISMGHVEYIELDRSVFNNILKRDYPEIFERMAAEESERSVRLAEGLAARGKTVALFVQSLLSEGAQEGQSLLTINLNKCIRCGNCVSACQSRHGHARVARRGKKLVRRENVDKQGSYETILLPASCRHCVNPECMIGCPTGAIHRTPSGEVDIRHTCIGCASCANRCPWGNITIVQTPGRKVEDPISKQEVIRDRLASKCNLCHGYSNANCVNNCPTGAILRVEPTTYWDEIAEVFQDANRKGVGHTDTVAKSSFAHMMLAAAFILASALMVGIWGYEWLTFGGHQGYSWPMLTLGGFATFGFMGAVMLAVRRRMKRFAFQGGTFLTWTRTHLYLGAFGLVAMLLHSGFQLGSTLTATLFLLTLAEVATGAFAVLYYKWLPHAITRLEGSSQVEEDVIAERHAIKLRAKELWESMGSDGRALVKRARSQAGGTLGRLGSGYDYEKTLARVREGVAEGLKGLTEEDRGAADRLVRDAVRAGDLSACLLLYKTRRAFLVSHIGMAAVLVGLVLVHIISVAFFWNW